MRVYRLLCWVYWPVLSALLLVPEPWRWLGFLRAAGPPGGRGAHLAAFTLLAVLVQGARWFRHGATALAVLALYGLVTEAGQALVPTRTCDFADLAENLAGIAIGSAMWVLLRTFERP